MGFDDLNRHDVDPKKIDELAPKNTLAKQTQLDIMQNSLRKAGSFFSFVTEAKVRAMAERLQSQGIGAHAIDAVIDKIINNFEKFPSYKNILELCAEHIVREKFECPRCSGGGLVSLYEKDTNQNVAFACDCKNGLAFPKFISIKSINLNKYSKLPAKVEGSYNALGSALADINGIKQIKAVKND